MQAEPQKYFKNHLWEHWWQEFQAHLVVISYFNSYISAINYTTPTDWWNSLKYIWAKTIKFPLRSRLEMSQYFTSTGIFTNNCTICYHSEILPASTYLKEVRILSIHKIFSPPGVRKKHNISLLMSFSYYYYFPVTALIRTGYFLGISNYPESLPTEKYTLHQTFAFIFKNLIIKWILASSLPL